MHYAKKQKSERVKTQREEYIKKAVIRKWNYHCSKELASEKYTQEMEKKQANDQKTNDGIQTQTHTFSKYNKKRGERE